LHKTYTSHNDSLFSLIATKVTKLWLRQPIRAHTAAPPIEYTKYWQERNGGSCM